MNNNVFSVAKIFCKTKNWNITNLALQKMLYIAQVFYIGMNNGQKLLDADFQAWDYGPVIPNVYRRFKMFGNKPIEDWAFPSDIPHCNKEDISFIETMAKKLVTLKSFQLVALTHQNGTAWAKVYIPDAKNIPIYEKDMITEYNEVWNKTDHVRK